MTKKHRGGVQRKYTVGEIDRMRRATWAILNAQWGTGTWHDDCEDRLRTFMLNGTSAQEVERVARGIAPIPTVHVNRRPEAGIKGSYVEDSLKAFLAHDPATDMEELERIVREGLRRPALMEELGLEAYRHRTRPSKDFGIIKPQPEPAVYDSAGWTGRR